MLSPVSELLRLYSQTSAMAASFPVETLYFGTQQVETSDSILTLSPHVEIYSFFICKNSNNSQSNYNKA